jgi:tetratricopeptide (TPR) repeat protein
VLAAGAQDDTTYGARAAYAARAEDFKALRALYREVQASVSARSGKRQYLLGQIAEMIDRREEALAWYRGITTDDEHWFDAHMRASVVLGDLGRTDDAIGQLHRLAELSAGDRLQQRNVWLLEADLLARAKRSREAFAVYDRALAALPDDARLLYSRALFAVEQGDVAAGERDLRRVLALSPDDAEAMNALGYTLADSSQPGDPRLAEALQLIQRALQLKPDEAAIIDSMGWVRYRMGDLEASLKELRRAHAKQPDAEIAAHLGEVLWVKGERAEAQKVWDEARRKDPDNRILLEAISRLATT